MLLFFNRNGDIAQLARAPALQAGGPGFESLLLHHIYGVNKAKVLRTPPELIFVPGLWRQKRQANERKTPRIRGRLAQLVRARH